MAESSPDQEVLLEQARKGDDAALGDLIQELRGRLRRMVDLRLDQRLKGRCDASDVVQAASLDIVTRFPEWSKEPDMPFYRWCRFLTMQKLMETARRHLHSKARDANRDRGMAARPAVDSSLLAFDLTDPKTRPDGKAVKKEAHQRVLGILEGLDEIDREVLVMRHFEQMSNGEIAAELGLDKSAASKRYNRAIDRIREALA